MILSVYARIVLFSALMQDNRPPISHIGFSKVSETAHFSAIFLTASLQNSVSFYTCHTYCTTLKISFSFQNFACVKPTISLKILFQFSERHYCTEIYFVRSQIPQCMTQSDPKLRID